MKSMMRKTTVREIKQSLGRYLAILAIVALGVGFFAGLRITKPAMLDTAQSFLDTHKFYDFRLVSTLGFEAEDVERIAALEGVKVAQSAISQVFLTLNREGVENAVIALSITDAVNTLELAEGNMPQNPDECVIDARYSGAEIGDRIQVAEDNDEDTKDMFQFTEYKVTGKVKSPLYVNFERGSTDLLDGRVSGFVYIPRAGFDSEYDTDIYVSFDTGMEIYSDAYNDFMESKEDAVQLAADNCLERRYDSLVSEAQDKIDDGQKELDEAGEKLADGQTGLDDANQQLTDANQKLEDGKEEIDDGQTQIDTARKQLAEQQEQLTQQKEQILTLPPAYAQAQQPQIDAAQAQLDAAGAELNNQQRKLDAAREELKESEQELADAQQEYDENLADFNKKKQEFEDAKIELADAQDELDDAIEDMSDRKVYVLGRDTNIGYMTFQNDSSIVEGIANVFPIFFFLVAALVCMTTMNRMVEEQRTQIGVLKALGYNSITIMNKYMFYSLSAAVIGGSFGFFLGCWLFPTVIWQAYGIMYDFSATIHFLFDPLLAVLVLLVALLCCGGATYFSCYYELSSQPSELIRPKAPKSGKRIFLERIPFLWSHMKFMQKVSIRNTIRYKKRFFMMILGISGCTALLVTGFGIKDSIANIVGLQFEEIEKYDASLNLDEQLSEQEEEKFAGEAAEWMDGYTLVHSGDLDLRANAVTKSVTMIVPKDTEQIEDFISIHDKNQNMLPYPQTGEIILTEKLADKLGVSVGDFVTLEDSDLNQLQLTISGICENYIYNYIYITAETYEQLTGEETEFGTAYVNYADGMSDEKALSGLLTAEHVSSVAGNSTIRERFGNMIESLDYIVLLIIACAGALAFIVLYNLTNINITERIREIATIKVLGFFPSEVSAYVLRENLVLTALGAIVGLFLGKALHAFVMLQIDIDVVHFPIQVKPVSYLYSFVLTFGFAILVNLFMSRKLGSIDMAESLKSIE